MANTYNADLQTNNASLEDILNTVTQLPQQNPIYFKSTNIEVTWVNGSRSIIYYVVSDGTTGVSQYSNSGTILSNVAAPSWIITITNVGLGTLAPEAEGDVTLVF